MRGDFFWIALCAGFILIDSFTLHGAAQTVDIGVWSFLLGMRVCAVVVDWSP